MVQFECLRLIYTMVSINFGVHFRVSLSLHAGKGKNCMWLVNKVEIPFAKIGFVDSIWSNLNAPACPSVLYPFVSLTLGSTLGSFGLPQTVTEGLNNS